MNDRLRLDDRFTHLVTVDACRVLVGDEDALLLEVPAATDVLPLLDGRSTAVEIAEALADAHPAALVHFVLLSLERAGITRAVVPADGSAAPDAGMAGLPGLLRTRWEGRGDARAVRIALRDDASRDVDIVLTDDGLVPELPGLCERNGVTPVLLACLGRRRVLIGPCFSDEPGPCPACLQDRLRLNLAARTLLHVPDAERAGELRVERLEREIPAQAFARLATGIAVIRTAPRTRWPRDRVVAMAFDERSERQHHHVPRLPHCPTCGDPAIGTPGARIALASRVKVARSGGGYRTEDPAVTLDRLTPFISPLTGVVRHVRRVPVEDTDLVHVYTASHALHYGTGDLGALKRARRDTSGGKGTSDLDARVSALCESLERFSGVHRGSERLHTGRQSDWGARAIHPNELLLFSDEQFRTRDAWNAADAGGFQWVPERYADQPIEWAEVRSLATGDTALVPAACVFLGFRGEGSHFCKGDSNGLAGGNALEEAILQGFLELVERDAVAIWWYNRVRRPAVDAATVRHPWVDAVLEYYQRRLGRSLWLLDLTTDLGIPCFAALSALENASRQDIIFGFGAHLDARIALFRALTEVNQMLPTILRTPAERRRQLLPDFESAIRWWDTATLDTHPYLLPDPAAAARRIDEFATPDSTDLLDDVRTCVARAVAAGTDVLVHDLTRPEIPFTVARVIVPGLRHFWRRLAPGRLYDVPARLGWLGEPLSEAELNPIPMFV